MRASMLVVVRDSETVDERVDSKVDLTVEK